MSESPLFGQTETAAKPDAPQTESSGPITGPVKWLAGLLLAAVTVSLLFVAAALVRLFKGESSSKTQNTGLDIGYTDANMRYADMDVAPNPEPVDYSDEPSFLDEAVMLEERPNMIGPVLPGSESPSGGKSLKPIIMDALPMAQYAAEVLEVELPRDAEGNISCHYNEDFVNTMAETAGAMELHYVYAAKKGEPDAAHKLQTIRTAFAILTGIYGYKTSPVAS